MLRTCNRRLSAAIAPKQGQSKVGYYASVAREGMRHVYHGFRLFFINTRLAWKYSRRLRQGVALTRRERLLLESSTQDLLRLVPFSFFIVVPFAELLLPVALKMFPGLIPSTFETVSQGRNRAFAASMQTLRARQRMMEYLSTVAFLSFDKDQQEVVRRAAIGESVTAKQIKLIAPQCGHDGPLSVYKIPDNIAVGLARTVGVHKWYHGFLPNKLSAPHLRGEIVKFYRNTRQDDRFISLEGLDDLTEEELIKANEVRGMRWTESANTLRLQLEWWVSLSRDPDVPYNTLFWVKPTRFSIQRSLSDLPVEQRQKLLGIANLPDTVRASLETLCDKVHTSTNGSNASLGADELIEKIEDLSAAVKKTDTDLGMGGIREAMGAYLTEENVKLMYAEILRNKAPNEPITVTDVVEYIGKKTYNSSHVVSTLFDAFDFRTGSKTVTEANLVSIGARCRRGHTESDAPATPQVPAK